MSSQVPDKYQKNTEKIFAVATMMGRKHEFQMTACQETTSLTCPLLVEFHV